MIKITLLVGTLPHVAIRLFTALLLCACADEVNKITVSTDYGESIEASKSKRSTQWSFSIYESNQLWFIFGRFSKLS